MLKPGIFTAWSISVECIVQLESINHALPLLLWCSANHVSVISATMSPAEYCIKADFLNLLLDNSQSGDAI